MIWKGKQTFNDVGNLLHQVDFQESIHDVNFGKFSLSAGFFRLTRLGLFLQDLLRWREEAGVGGHEQKLVKDGLIACGGHQ